MTAPTRFDEQGVLLNEHGLAAAGRFFPLRNLRGTSLRLARRSLTIPAILGAIGLAIAAAGLWFGSIPAVIGGIMVIAVGILNWSIQDVVHYLYVDTPDGAQEAVSSKDAGFLARVAQAIDTAVAARADQTDQAAG